MDFKHAYCLFCRTGAEQKLCDEIQNRFDSVLPLYVQQEKHKSVGKQHEIERRSFLPGYLFLYSQEAIDFQKLLKMDGCYRILGDRDTAHELTGSDRAFADWLYRNNGLVGISRIRIREGTVHVLTGPMRYFSKQILKVDKHTKNALVKMVFLGESREMWLAFEFDDEAVLTDREEGTI